MLISGLVGRYSKMGIEARDALRSKQNRKERKHGEKLYKFERRMRLDTVPEGDAISNVTRAINSMFGSLRDYWERPSYPAHLTKDPSE